MLKRFYKNLGDYSAERQKWQKAAKYFKLAHDNETVCIERLANDQFGAPVEFSRSWIDTKVARYTARIS